MRHRRSRYSRQSEVTAYQTFLLMVAGALMAADLVLAAGLSRADITLAGRQWTAGAEPAAWLAVVHGGER